MWQTSLGMNQPGYFFLHKSSQANYWLDDNIIDFFC